MPDFLWQKTELHSTSCNLQTVFVEGFHQYPQDLMEKSTCIERKCCWLSHFDNELRVDNDTMFNWIGASLISASNEGDIVFDCSIKLGARASSSVGFYLTVLDKRNMYNKGYTTVWKAVLCRMKETSPTTLTPYTLEDKKWRTHRRKNFSGGTFE